jgi:hypothetical protein
VGETRQAFTSAADTAFDVCFENHVDGRSTSLTFFLRRTTSLAPIFLLKKCLSELLILMCFA